MEYILLIVALAISIVGVRGTTWDDNEEGLKKLTSAGRLAVSLATIYCVLSLAEVYLDQSKSEQNTEFALSNLAQSVGKAERFSIDVMNLRADDVALNDYRWARASNLLQDTTGTAESQIEIMAPYIKPADRDLFIQYLELMQRVNRKSPKEWVGDWVDVPRLASKGDFVRRSLCEDLSDHNISICSPPIYPRDYRNN